MKLKLTTALFVSASIFSSLSCAHVWTGYYAGINAGVVGHTMTMTDNNATTFNASLDQITNPKLTAGLQVGYRRQLDPTKISGVYGVEFSANFADASFSRQYGSPFALYQFDANNSLKTVALLELTAGIPADKTLFFLAAGLSWTRITGSTNSVGGAPFFNSFSVDKNIFGTALGVGVEYLYSPCISVRFKVDAVMPNDYSTSDDVGDTFQISNHIVQGTIGVNYLFA